MEEEKEIPGKEIEPMSFNQIVIKYLINAPEGLRPQRIARFRTFLALVKCETDINIPQPPDIMNIKQQFQISKYGRILHHRSPEEDDDEFSGIFNKFYNETLEIELMQSVAEAIKKLYNKKLITYETYSYAGGLLPIADEDGTIGVRTLPRRR